MSDPSAIGIHEGAYFVSKKELTDWLAAEFGIFISKIESCGDGVAYLKIFNRLFPEKVNLRKAKKEPRTEYERLHNLKLLQTAFSDCGVERNIDINRLARCQSLDNLEFLQWCRSYYDKKTRGGAPSVAKHSSSAGAAAAAPHHSNPSTHHHHPPPPGARGVIETSAPSTRTRQSSSGPRRAAGNRAAAVDNSEVVQQLRAELLKTREELARAQMALADADNESQFFWGKLRALELKAEEAGRQSFTVKEVQDILFDTNPAPEELIAGDDDCDDAQGGH